MARAINNYLTPDEGLGNTLGNISSRIKNTVLSAGIPKTGINFHGLNILTRNTLASSNPIKSFMTGAGYLLKPSVAQDYIDNNLQGAADAIRSGLNLSIEDHNFMDNTIKSSNLPSKMSDFLHDTFSKQLFEQVLPALKIQKFQSITDDLVKSGVEPNEAKQTAAQTTNNIYGGQNIEAVARSRGFQNLMRNIVFAPDWLESTAKTGGNIVKAISDPRNPLGKTYRVMARNLIMGYIAERIC